MQQGIDRPGRVVRVAVVCGVTAATALAGAGPAAAEWQDLGLAGATSADRSTSFAMNGRGDLVFGFGRGLPDTSPFLVRRRAGATFRSTTPAVETGAAPTDGQPALTGVTVAAGADGTATAVWNQRSAFGTGGRAVVGLAGGVDGSWGSPARPIAPATEDVNPPLPDRTPKVVAGPDGTYVAVWTDGDRLYSSARSKTGAWSAAKPFGSAGQVSKLIDVVRDDAGRVSVVFLGPPGGGGPGIGSITRATNGTWGAAQVAPTNYRCVGTRGCSFPNLSVAVAGDGTLTVAYDADSRDYGVAPRYDDQVWAVQKPVGSGWKPARKLFQNASYEPLTVDAVSSSKSGVTLVTWTAEDGVVRAAHSTEDGTWSAPFEVAPRGRGQGSVENRVQGVITVLVQTDDGLRTRDFYPWNGSWSRTYDVPTRFAAPGALSSGYQLGTGTAIGVDDRSDTAIAYKDTGDPDGPVAVVVDDQGGPEIGSFAAPATLAPAAKGTFSATAVDAYSGVSGATWSFGDGATATGLKVSHAYAKAGTYQVTLTASDGHGNRSTTVGKVVVTAQAATRVAAARASSEPRTARVSRLRLRAGRVDFRTSAPAALNVVLQRKVGEDRRGRARFAPAGVVQVDVTCAGSVVVPTRLVKAGHTYRATVARRGSEGGRVRPAGATQRVTSSR